MRIVTLEEHYSTQKFQEAIGPGYELAARMPQVQAKLLDIGAGRIAEMDQAGIDVQILSFTGFGLYELSASKAEDVAKDANLKVAEAMKTYPGRFGGLATLPLQDPESAAREFERCVNDLGFCGAMVDGTVAGAFLDRPEFIPVFEAAAALDVPIYLHPAPPPAEVRKAYTDDLKPPLNFLLATAAWGWHVETGLHALRLSGSPSWAY
jgi:predicted TIM-barrel fold metal-dependent hydrolase